MTKKELVERVVRKKGLPRAVNKKTVCLVLDSAFAELGHYFIRAKLTRKGTPRFTYPGFGTFTKRRRNGRVVRDPRRGTPIEVPPRSTVWFAPGLELKAQLNPGRRLFGGREHG